MSKNKASELKISEIDKSKRRHKTDDTAIATAALNSGEDSIPLIKMEVMNESVGKPTDLSLHGASHLMSSTTSSLADTPGDSGVLCLDSEASEAASQALMAHSMLGAEELTCDTQCDLLPSSSQELATSTTSGGLTRRDIDNQNMNTAPDDVPELVGETHSKSPIKENLPDVVLKALESEMVSTKDTGKTVLRTSEPKKSMSEDIVYRRRCRKKSQSGSGSQKKRVSFHEDILKNTRTDNIHIERGFISYGPDSSYCDRFRQKNNIQADRFSWCATGDRSPRYATDIAKQTMSDILTYGTSDSSGVFEYVQSDKNNALQENKDNNNEVKPYKKMYGCDSNSSDSNFSCDSESSSSSSSSNSNKTETLPVHKKEPTQKSYSCDGFESSSHVSYMKKTYFSEADIDQTHDRSTMPLEVSSSPGVKSVLKKNRYITTNVVEERKTNSKVLNLLDTKNLMGSLKNFYKNFNFKFTPEKGLTETSLDLNNAVEALPSDVNHNKKLSKSLDSGFQIDDEEDFVEINLNEQLVDNDKSKQMSVMQNSNISGDRTPKEGSPRHKLTLNMKQEKKPDKADYPPLSKYVVNCESMVYEHKGVSYSYVHDTFQTAFDAPKQSFVPIPETAPTEMTTSATLTLPDSKSSDMETSSKTSTPKRHFSRCQEEDLKNGNSKHLSSPKRQNVNRYCRKSASTLSKDIKNEEVPMNTKNSEDGSNADNSTLKGDDDFPDEFIDSPSHSKLQSNKSALLNRYLKNVCQKKDLEQKIRKNKFFQKKLASEKGFPSIIYPFKLVSENFRVSAERMSRLIDKEVIENKRLSVRLLTADEPSYYDSFEDNVAIECSEKLRLQIFTYPNETLNRMMKVQSMYSMEDGSWTPLLVFITDYALYVVCVKPDGTNYETLCRLTHDELDAIAVGPEAHYIQVIDVAGNIACSVVTGETSLGVRLVSSLEWSARTSPLRIARPPAIVALSCKQLAASIAKKRHEKQVPRLLYYGRVCCGDSSDRLVESPGAFAPPLEGYLMCKMWRSRIFEPCYFLLRAGVLQWDDQAPEAGAVLRHSLPLRDVVGVRRVGGVSLRPHCFEVDGGGGRRLLLAAADEPAASAWLQSLLIHAAQALEKKDGTNSTNRHSEALPAACSVIVTPHEVVGARESPDRAFVAGAAAYLRDRGADALLREYIEEMRSDVEILACGSIKDLTAFKIPGSDDNWCCLEWSVCEARERGASLALVFASGAELEKFIAAVEDAFCALTSEPFPLSVVADSSKAPSGTAHAQFSAAWAHMLPAHQ